MTGEQAKLPVAKQVLIVADLELEHSNENEFNSKSAANHTVPGAPNFRNHVKDENTVVSEKNIKQVPPALQKETNQDGLHNNSEENNRKVVGKKASRRIETDTGVLIVEQGGEITEEVLQKAKLAGKFVELSMNV